MIIEISKFNPIKFYKFSKESSAKYLFRYFDDYMVKDNKLSFQSGYPWMQPWQQTDIIKIQIQSDTPDLKLGIMTCDRQIVTFSVFSIKTTNWKNTGLEVYEASLNLSTIANGYYYIGIFFENSIMGISDPISILQEQPNTIFFEYKHRINKLDLAFDTDIEFGVRLPAVLQDFQPSSDNTVYIDQYHNSVLLHSVPYRIYTLIVGDAYGVPDYIADLLNRILGVSSVKFDNVLFCKTEQSNMQRNGVRDYQMAGWAIEVIESESIDSIDVGLVILQVYGDGSTVYIENNDLII